MIWLHGLDDTAENWANGLAGARARHPTWRWLFVRAPERAITAYDGRLHLAWGDFHEAGAVRVGSRDYDGKRWYAESIAVLEHARRVNPAVVTKTSIMLGLGERAAEVRQTMRDMRDAGVEIFTLGQYLRPSKRHMPVARMLPPEEYDAFREDGLALGFKYVASGPLVRSSYKAGEVFMEAFLEEREREEAERDRGRREVPAAAASTA